MNDKDIGAIINLTSTYSDKIMKSVQHSVKEFGTKKFRNKPTNITPKKKKRKK